MELLQAVQYISIDNNMETLNYLTTIVSYIHICFQPVFLNLFQEAFSKNKTQIYKQVVYPLCLIGGIGMLLRLKSVNNVYDNLYNKILINYQNSTCLCSNHFDHFESDYTLAFLDDISKHIGWNISLHKITYLSYGLNIHGFLTFVLPFVIERTITIPTSVYIFGISAGIYYSNNIHVQPAIWCFVHIPLMIVSLLFYGHFRLINNFNVHLPKYKKV
jgi:hypothetical protein